MVPSKGRSPFSPGAPVIPELFVGRTEQIEQIVDRGIKQVIAGKPMAFFIEGEYGIGKSSVANLIRWVAAREYGIFGIYAPLGSASDLKDVAEIILQQTIRAGYLDQTRWESLRDKLAKYVGQQQLSLVGFGLNLNFDALKTDAPQIATHLGLLDFLGDVLARLSSASQQAKGIMLVLDEINGLAATREFSLFLKSLWEANAADPERQLPLLLMLCGTAERKLEMIQQHEPVGRIFDLVRIEPLSAEEMEAFFRKAFGSVQMTVDQGAMEELKHFSAGFPRLMHLIGDACYWVDTDGVITEDEAVTGVIGAAEELGRKFVDAKVYDALQSKDYHNILRKIGQLSPSTTTFTRGQALAGLSDPEKQKFDNFLTKMKNLHVIRGAGVRGEYEFTNRMVRLYIWLRSRRKQGRD